MEWRCHRVLYVFSIHLKLFDISSFDSSLLTTFYSVSYLWYSVIGMTVVLVVGVIVSLITCKYSLVGLAPPLPPVFLEDCSSCKFQYSAYWFLMGPGMDFTKS